MPEYVGMAGTPSALRAQQTVRAPEKKLGLVPMAPGSPHLIQTAHGEFYEQARPYDDYRDAKAVYFCQHERCRGKTWKTHEAMREDHPQPTEMQKRIEVHVYGLWSDDVAEPERLKKAEANLKRLEKDNADWHAKPVQTLTERELLREADKDLDKARAEHAAARSVIGLIAPPDDE